MEKLQLKIWLSERLPFISQIDSFLRQKTVPRHKYSIFYLFGGLSLFLFGIQLVTGILLALYYEPTPENANESIKRIITEVSFGWLVRSIHAWGADFMVAAVLMHMFSTYFMKAYRKPREFMWLSGSIILFLILGFAFTGYLLPWDTTAYFATQIGTEIPKSIPLVGELVVTLLRGGGEIGSEALRRMYMIHVTILPIVSLVLILFHVTLQQVLGTSKPIGIPEKYPAIPFLPNYIYRDIIVWTYILILLLGVAMIRPVAYGDKVDEYASAPVGIKPEWYFLPLYQTLRVVPTTVFSLNGEMLVNICLVIGSVVWVAIPFLDRRANREENNVVFQLLGIILVLYCAISVVVGKFT